MPAGAFWGGEDIRKMAEQGSLKVFAFILEMMCV